METVQAIEARVTEVRQAVADAAAVVAADKADTPEAKAALSRAQGAAAIADLDYANAMRKTAREAEARQENIELGQRNLLKRVELILSGELTVSEIDNGTPRSAVLSTGVLDG